MELRQLPERAEDFATGLPIKRRRLENAVAMRPDDDLFPTFLDAAGAAVPQGKTLDRESLLPLLKQEGPLKRRAIFWHFPDYLNSPMIRGRDLDVRTGFRSRQVSLIHQGDWKLHLYHEEWQLDGGREKLAENNAVEFYHLNEDIGERNNLAASQPKKRDELRMRF